MRRAGRGRHRPARCRAGPGSRRRGGGHRLRRRCRSAGGDQRERAAGRRRKSARRCAARLASGAPDSGHRPRRRCRCRRPRSAGACRRSPCGNRAGVAQRGTRAGRPTGRLASPARAGPQNGRLRTVVLPTISASIPASIAARAISSICAGSRSGATLRNSGVVPRAAAERASKSVSAAPCWRSRRPGVLGELMLIVT